MASYIWLIPALPLLGVIINTLLGVVSLRQAAHAHHGSQHAGHGAADHGPGHGTAYGRLAGIIASAVVGLAFVLTLVAFFQLRSFTPEERVLNISYWQWIAVGSFEVPFAFLIDQLALTMMLLVTGVGFLIHVYSIGYMAHDDRQVRYFAYLNLFIVAMLLLVMANNFVLLFLGWEGVGLCSFLLIGFWFERKEAKAAATKAFVVNRIGDFGLMLAMFAIWKLAGTLTFTRLEEVVIERIAPVTFAFLGDQVTAAGAITLLLLLGVTGKSAQIPLYVWLPDAMAGPTPVSALIHAATMVTAGVYLMVRTHWLFVLAPNTLDVVAWVGALTALAGALTAIGQYDIKKVLAYSTVSQLGYMVAGFGVGAAVAAMFHLLTHGLFKALLFLGSGSVIHGAGDNQDMRRMGGLKDSMPITFWTFVIGALALAGIPIFAGFWSKDEIIGMAWDIKRPIAYILIFSSMLTAFYMARQISLVFLGKQRDTSYHAHESPKVMTVPLIILAGGTILGGLINLPSLPLVPHALEHALHGWLEPLLHEQAAPFHLGLAIVVVILAALSGWAGWYIYGRRPIFPKVTSRDPLWRTTGIFYEMLEDRLWLDDLYNFLVVRPFRWTARFLSSILDAKIIDGAVNGSAWVVGRTGAALRQVQTGYLRTYALMFLLGVVAVIGYFALR